MSTETGLESRYHVRKIKDPEGKHDECRYFVLDPQHDPLALRALRVYAAAANSGGYVRLAADLWKWIDEIEDRNDVDRT
jgi:hypothetical protein